MDTRANLKLIALAKEEIILAKKKKKGGGNENGLRQIKYVKIHQFLILHAKTLIRHLLKILWNQDFILKTSMCGDTIKHLHHISCTNSI